VVSVIIVLTLISRQNFLTLVYFFGIWQNSRQRSPVLEIRRKTRMI
jgi:hypothetical protein